MTIRQLLILTIIALLPSCGHSLKSKELTKADLMKAFVEKIGCIDLPYSHNLITDKEDYNYYIDSKSTDTLFFSDYNRQIIGVLPNTSDFYAILYYEVGDDLYPSLKTFDKQGELIDSKMICYGYCAGCIRECVCDSCSDFTTIDHGLKITMTYRTKGFDCDSIGEKIPNTTFCRAFTTDGYIKPDGMIVLNKQREESCE